MEKTLSEDYCSYELAKLLKEKGFDCWCEHYIFENYEDYKSEGTGRPTNWNKYGGHTSIPSLSLAMKWLREVHKLFIVIEPEYFEAGRVIAYDFSVWCGDNYKHYFKDYPTFEEAVEAALKHVLENLI